MSVCNFVWYFIWSCSFWGQTIALYLLKLLNLLAVAVGTPNYILMFQKQRLIDRPKPSSLRRYGLTGFSRDTGPIAPVLRFRFAESSKGGGSNKRWSEAWWLEWSQVMGKLVIGPWVAKGLDLGWLLWIQRVGQTGQLWFHLGRQTTPSTPNNCGADDRTIPYWKPRS